MDIHQQHKSQYQHEPQDQHLIKQQRLQQPYQQLHIRHQVQHQDSQNQLQDQQQIMQNQQQINNLMRQLQQLKSIITTEQEKSQSLQKRCELLESTSATEQEKSQTLQKRCKLLESTSAAEKEKSQSLQKRCDLLESTSAAEQEKSQLLQKRCELLESTSSTEQAKSQLLQKRCELLESTSSTEQEKSQSLQKRCELLESASATEQEKLQSLERRCQSLESSLAAQQAKCQTLESNLIAEQQKLYSRYQNHEERLKEVEDTVEQLWSISRDEVKLSNKIIGTGGWGYVTKASFRGRKVAAKCLHKAITSQHNRQLFAKEMKIFARCRHSNLLEFIGAVPDDPAIIVTELMDTNLREALNDGKATPNHIHPICMHVAQALSYLHGIQPHPLIHRDVSAPNVLLKAVDKGWIAKLSDLGSAQFANIAQTLAPGCAIYAAPEVRHETSARHQTAKMDVYSYGVLLIEVLTREMPIGEVEALITSIQPMWSRYVPLIRQCITNEPLGRPDMTKVIATLNAIIL